MAGEYNVQEREGIDASWPVYQTTKIEMGNLVSVNAAGYLIESTDTASTFCVGVAEKTVDNSSGSSGDLHCPVRSNRLFRIKNSATGSAVTTAAGRVLVFVEDSEKVVLAAGSTNKVIVGIVEGDVTADWVWVRILAPALYAGSAAIDFAVGQDLAVTRDATVGRNATITGTLLQTGVATFTAKSVHSLGITITAGGQTITLGNILATKGNITATEGNILATLGNITATEGNIVATKGDVVISKGALTMTAGSATLTKGDLTLTEGALTMTKGALLVTAGNITCTAGIIKAVGVLATDGMQIGYVSGAITEPPKIAELETHFGATAAGRNGFIGTVRNSGGNGKKYLCGIANAVWNQIEWTTVSA